MILTLTLNPAVDETVWIDRLEPGSVHRVADAHLDPAGKGINVSRMADRLGCATMAFGLVGGDAGDMIEKALGAEGVQHYFVRVPGETRINFTVVERGGRASSFYGPGPHVPAEALASLERVLERWLAVGSVLVLAGSLPRGVGAGAYATYVRMAREAGVRVVLDTSGDALREGVAARPDLIKPNVREAEELLDRSLGDDAAILGAARELAARVRTVVISMGARGAICVRGGEAWRVHTPVVERRSTVGPGDSMVAGMAVALARGAGVEAALALGTAAGAATAAASGTALGSAEDVRSILPRVRVERIEDARTATERAP
ncbi:MAG TPA: 1-phosphofructokinase [Sandaracinaceae bacterium]